MQTYSLINTGASLDATLIHGKSCKLYGVDCMNNNATIAYIYFYDTSITPTNAMTPVRRYMIPVTGGLVRLFGNTPLLFTSGLGFLVKAGVADNDNTNVTASTVLINVDWG